MGTFITHAHNAILFEVRAAPCKAQKWGKKYCNKPIVISSKAQDNPSIVRWYLLKRETYGKERETAPCNNQGSIRKSVELFPC